MYTAFLLILAFLFYCFMLWGMCPGATGGGGYRRGDTIGFLIFAIVTYSLAVGGGFIIASFYM